jgi:DNA-directed RNA polymerase subunit RPC12/RpoP
MQIIAKCPGCGGTWSLDSSAADRRIKCRKCSMLFKIPKLNELPKAIKVIKKAKSNIYVDEDGKSYG